MHEVSGFLQRLRGRLSYGLLSQELLDRLRVLGVTFYPYLLMVESPERLAPEAPMPLNFSTRLLTHADIPLITAIKERPQRAHELGLRLDRGRLGMGLFFGSELAGYSWCNLEFCQSFFDRKLFQLNSDEACLLDAYIRPPFRGQGLAPLLRRAISTMLMDEGRHTFYSVSLLFNASTHRFKRKLGAREMELHLYLNVFKRWEKDIVLRRYLPRPPREPPTSGTLDVE